MVDAGRRASTPAATSLLSSGWQVDVAVGVAVAGDKCFHVRRPNRWHCVETVWARLWRSRMIVRATGLKTDELREFTTGGAAWLKSRWTPARRGRHTKRLYWPDLYKDGCTCCRMFACYCAARFTCERHRPRKVHRSRSAHF